MYSRLFCNKIQSAIPLYKNPLNVHKYYVTNCSNYCINISKARGIHISVLTKTKCLTTSQSLASFRHYLHTTKPSNALPPIIWVVLRSLLKFAAVITGRGLRKWWKTLPKNRRRYFLNEISKKRYNIVAVSVLFSGLVYIYYEMNLVEDPITKRKKFLIFSDAQINQMSMIECEVIMENYKGRVIKSGYKYQLVLNAAQRILRANNDLPGIGKPWQVLLIDEEETVNACVLPSGHIFVFTGILKATSNEDQLAAVLSHEIAHALLSHSAEAASVTHLFEMLMILPLVALWTFFPDSVAISSHYITEYMSSVLFRLPFSRKIETEADSIGLEMMARACYDPKQASVFWRKMEKLSDDEEDIEWLSTHPSHKTRYHYLDSLMPEAIETRIKFCSKFTTDPRSERLIII